MKKLVCHFALVFALTPFAAEAQTTEWINPGTGEWFDAANWNNGVPVGAGTADIDNGGTIQIASGSAAAAYRLGVGNNIGSGTLQIIDGSLTIGDFVTLGLSSLGAAGSGSLLVSGSNATLTMNSRAYIGRQAMGTLTVADGGRAVFNGSAAAFSLGADASGTGFLNLQGTSGARGMLEANGIIKGDGSGTITFDGGILRALSSQANFLQNFEAGDVTINAGGAFIDSNGFAVGISAVLGGSGSLTKLGAGTLTLTGSNTYTGGTIVDAGKLVLGDASNAGSLVSVTDVAVVRVDGGDFEVVNGAVTAGSGAGGTSFGGNGGMAVVQTSAGTITNSGTLQGGSGGAAVLGGIGNSMGGSGGAAVSIHSTSTVTNNGTIRGGNGGSASTGLGISTGGDGGAGLSFAASGTLLNSGTIAGGNGGTGVIGGAGGAGLIVSNGASVENAGGASISGGLSGFGVRANGIQFTGTAGTLVNQGTILGGVAMGDFANDVTLHTGSVISQGGLNMGTSTASHLTLTGTGSQNLSTAVGTALTFNGALTKAGTGTWTIDRNLAYSGAGVVNSGTLVVGASGSLVQSGTLFTVGQNPGDDSHLVVSGGYVEARAFRAGQSAGSQGTLTLDSGTMRAVGLFDDNAAGSSVLTINGGLLDLSGFGAGANIGGDTGSGIVMMNGGTWNSPTTYVNNNAVVTINGGLVTSEVLQVGRKVGNSGTVNITGGTWEIGSVANIGSTGDGTLNISGGKMTVNGTTRIGFNGSSSGALLLSDASGQQGVFETQLLRAGGVTSSVVFDGGILRALADQADFFQLFEDGEVTINEGGAYLDTNGHNMGILDALTGTGGLTKLNSGTLTLAGNNTYTGTTTISAGTLQIGNGGTSGGLAGDVANDSVLMFNRSNNNTHAGVISGTGRLIKDGLGAVTLSGSNTYAGGTVISAGTVVITDVGEAASALGTGSVDVEVGGTLAGVGTVLGDTMVAGTLAPGNSPGAMQFGGNLFLNGTAVVEMELAGLANFDEIGVAGMLTYDGELSIMLLGGYLPGIGDTFDLFDAATVTGASQFDVITFNVAGYDGALDYGTGVLTITAVPEPSAGILLAIAMIALAMQRRRVRGPRVAAYPDRGIFSFENSDTLPSGFYRI